MYKQQLINLLDSQIAKFVNNNLFEKIDDVLRIKFVQTISEFLFHELEYSKTEIEILNTSITQDTVEVVLYHRRIGNISSIVNF